MPNITIDNKDCDLDTLSDGAAAISGSASTPHSLGFFDTIWCGPASPQVGK